LEERKLKEGEERKRVSSFAQLFISAAHFYTEKQLGYDLRIRSLEHPDAYLRDVVDASELRTVRRTS